MSNGTIKKVAGPLVIAEGMRDANMFDVVRVSDKRLIGENIEIHGDEASIQVYEETSGLGPGAPVTSPLRRKVKIDIVICKIPVDTLGKTVQETLYTGNYGDGKIFIYDVEDVVKIRTGERGYDALQDVEIGED